MIICAGPPRDQRLVRAVGRRGNVSGKYDAAAIPDCGCVHVRSIEILRDGATAVGAQLASPQPLSVGAEIAIELVASAFRNFARRYRDCRSSTVHRLLRRP